MSLRIAIPGDRTSFRPAEELTGHAIWSLAEAPPSAELRLFWFTRGKGTTDVSVIETVCFEHPMATDSRAFLFRLPEAPYSFSGKLISLVWALELVVAGSPETPRVEFVLAPAGQEVRLDGPAAGASTSPPPAWTPTVR